MVLRPSSRELESLTQLTEAKLADSVPSEFRGTPG
jgi:hypothetical protein